MITQDELKTLLDYNPETGVFIWKVKRKGSTGIGTEAGTVTHKGYKDVCINYKKYGLHRLAFLYMTGLIPENVDHKNGIKSDNKWLNLRPATIRENAFNYKGWGSKSQHKNVYYDKRGNKKWFVLVTKADGQRISLGYFHTPEEAGVVAARARKEYHGEFFHEL